jgi:hypothetical protein
MKGKVAEVPTRLRDGWYVREIDADFDLKQCGIYEWRIEGIGLYVGKAKNLQSRIRAYPNNVRRMIDGEPWHGNPKRAYRRVHHELRRAYEDGVAVVVTVLEICDPDVRAERETHWIAIRQRESLIGGLPLLNSN